MLKRVIVLLVAFCSCRGFCQQTFSVVEKELIVSSPLFKQCHASSIVQLPGGEMMVAFFAGSAEGNKDVCIWTARREGKKWSRPVIVADGTVNGGERYPCWNPVLFSIHPGNLCLYYKVGPNPREWWGMVKTSVDNGRSWSPATRLPPGVLGPVKNKPVRLADGTILSPSSTETQTRWQVHIERSADSGRTWNIIPVDSSSPYKVIQPSILKYTGKRLQIICRSDQDRLVASWSDDNGNSWSRLTKLDLPNPNSGIDAVTLKSGMQLLVYNPAIRGKEWFNNRSKLHVAVSEDGISWKDIAVLENGTRGEFSYPAVIESADGRVHLTYTYDRKNIKYVVLHPGGGK